jgi:uncharacterized protein (DUF1015 family)
VGAMPALRPFRAVHFDLATRPDLSSVVAPPFDEIDDRYREVLEARDPCNVVRLEKERERPGGGDPGERYARAARFLREWRAAGVLVEDRRPAIWITEQRFAHGGGERVRRGFYARLRLHPFEDGLVLPHERTEERPWRDRLALYRATAFLVSPVHVLYPDDDGRLGARLAPVAARPPDAVARTERDGTEHRLWRVEDRGLLAGLSAALQPLRVYIADGHHRYLSSLAYARWCEERGAGPEGAHRWVLACFTSMTDPGLVFRATHRVVRGLPALDPGKLFTLLDEHFEVETLAVDPAGAAGRAWALRRLAEAGRTSHAFLAATRRDRQLRLLVLKEGIDLAGVSSLTRNPTLRALDVELLDGLVLRHVLGIDAAAPGAGENLELVAGADEALDRALSPDGEGDVAFLLNPASIWQIRAVAEAGEVMPLSSATIFPRLPGGLVMAGIAPGEEA